MIIKWAYQLFHIVFRRLHPRNRDDCRIDDFPEYIDHLNIEIHQRGRIPLDSTPDDCLK